MTTNNNNNSTTNPYLLSDFDRKTIMADIRSIKRKLEQQPESTIHVDFKIMTDQLIAKYCQITGMMLVRKEIGPAQARAELRAYQTEIPKLVRQEFGLVTTNKK